MKYRIVKATNCQVTKYRVQVTDKVCIISFFTKWRYTIDPKTHAPRTWNAFEEAEEWVKGRIKVRIKSGRTNRKGTIWKQVAVYQVWEGVV